MTAWVTFIGGLLKLVNWAAQALQQHHDELNGANRVIAKDNQENAQAEHAAAKAMVDTTRDSVIDQLRDGSA